MQQNLKRVQGTQLFRPDCLLPLATQVDYLEQALQIAYASEVLSRGRQLVPDQATRANLHKVAEWLTNPLAKPWLLIYGGVGNGKTTLLRAIQAFVNSQRFYIGNTRVQMLVQTASRLSALAVESPRLFESRTDQECIGIDDLGVEPLEVNSFGTRSTPIAELLLHRYERMRFTILTSNLSEEQLTSRYGERITDRLREVCDRLWMDGASYRGTV